LPTILLKVEKVVVPTEHKVLDQAPMVVVAVAEQPVMVPMQSQLMVV